MLLEMMNVEIDNRDYCIGEIYSEWTFEFDGEKDGAVNKFQIRGHGHDKHTRLHDLRHIIMNNYTIRTNSCALLFIEDRGEHLLWSLRFDGRRIRTVFNILEQLIEGFRIIHLPNTKYALSAYEHSLISNAGREYFTHETMNARKVSDVSLGNMST